MELFATDRERMAFLLETDAPLDLDFEALEARPGSSSPRNCPDSAEVHHQLHRVEAEAGRLIWKHTPRTWSRRRCLLGFGRGGLTCTRPRAAGPPRPAALLLPRPRPSSITANVRLPTTTGDFLLGLQPRAVPSSGHNFKGIFFAKASRADRHHPRQHRQARGLQKDIALFALCKTCMSGKAVSGTSPRPPGTASARTPPEEFRKRFRKNRGPHQRAGLRQRQGVQAFRKDVNEFLPEVKADLAYFDPPYATEFSTQLREGLPLRGRADDLLKGLSSSRTPRPSITRLTTRTVTRANAGSSSRPSSHPAPHPVLAHLLPGPRPPSEQQCGNHRLAGPGVVHALPDHHYASPRATATHPTPSERLFICRQARAGRPPRKPHQAAGAMTSRALEETENEIRYRVRDPDEVRAGQLPAQEARGRRWGSPSYRQFKKEFVPEGHDPRAMGAFRPYRFAARPSATRTLDHGAGRGMDQGARASAATRPPCASRPTCSPGRRAPRRAVDLLTCQAGKVDAVRVHRVHGPAST